MQERFKKVNHRTRLDLNFYPMATLARILLSSVFAGQECFFSCFFVWKLPNPCPLPSKHNGSSLCSSMSYAVLQNNRLEDAQKSTK